MNKQRNIFIFCCVLCIVAGAPVATIKAQDTARAEVPLPNSPKSSIFIGTQIPLQFTAGYAYRFSHKVSGRAQAGFITKPYSGFIVDAMEAFGLDKYLGRVIRKSFENGVVFGVGPNVHFGKNYLGVYGQYMHLKGGGITPADALSIHFQQDFSQFNLTGVPAFEFAMQSNIFNAGILFGRSFQLRNPDFGINAEVGMAKIIGSKNSFSSNRPLVDQTVFARGLYTQIDKSMREAYLDHGYIPTVNLYLVYHLR